MMLLTRVQEVFLGEGLVTVKIMFRILYWGRGMGRPTAAAPLRSLLRARLEPTHHVKGPVNFALRLRVSHAILG